MILNAAAKNARTLERELKWMHEVISASTKIYFKNPCEVSSVFEITPPDVTNDTSVYAAVIKENRFGFEERFIMALSLTPHVKPQLLDFFFNKNKPIDRVFTEFGGLKGRYHSGFLPTGETAAFVLACNNLEARFRLIEYFKPEHPFARKNILKLQIRDSTEPLLCGGLEISEEYLSLLTTGKPYKPDFSTSFPAKRLTTRMDWSDLVLDPHVLSEISEIAAWIQHQDTIMNKWGLGRQLKRGYRSLFYGPPGTGKTLTACLLGKSLGLDVYRVDLSQVVSKYIGETEKNMASIFDQAENKNWILFFDEADALFGKRTATSDSKDRHANQEVAYLLQRVEDFSGVVILATNLRANMDVAFTRRFQSIIFFPAPNAEQRYALWTKSFAGIQMAPDVDYHSLANEYVLTGGSIINVLRYCSLMALRRGTGTVTMDDMREGVRRELRKEGKTPDR